MKVRVTITLDVDEEAWCLEYGLARAELREDVRSYVNNMFSDLTDRGIVRDYDMK